MAPILIALLLGVSLCVAATAIAIRDRQETLRDLRQAQVMNAERDDKIAAQQKLINETGKWVEALKRQVEGRHHD